MMDFLSLFKRSERVPDMPAISEQEEFWSGAAGDAYISRCRVDWAERIPFWEHILSLTNAESVLEVGCNAGWNLLALRRINRQLDLKGIDVNRSAIDEALMSGLNVQQMRLVEAGKEWPGRFDLAFSAGVLIHVHPNHLSAAMDSIILSSKRFVLAVEYESEHETMVPYRSLNDRLWKRPFGRLYQDKGLKLIETMDAGSGFDKCVAHVLEKN